MFVKETHTKHACAPNVSLHSTAKEITKGLIKNHGSNTILDTFQFKSSSYKKSIKMFIKQTDIVH